MRLARLTVLATLALALLAAPLAAEGQPPGKTWRIGLLDYANADAARVAWWNALRQRLRELGYVEGQSVVFESRWGNGDLGQLQTLAADLINARVDIIVTGGSEAALAAKQATSSIPIVMATGADPVALGLVASLGRPGGNVTGVTSIQSELAAKRLELLKQVIPTASRVAILWDTDNRASALSVVFSPDDPRDANDVVMSRSSDPSVRARSASRANRFAVSCGSARRSYSSAFGRSISL